MTKKIRFLGFANEAAVEIEVRNNGVTKGPIAVSGWGTDATQTADDFGTMSISMFREPSISAPEHVRLTANITSGTGLRTLTNGDVGNALYTTYDQQMHELEFVWTFSKATDPQPDVAAFGKVARLPDAWKTKNKASGKYAAHIFEKEGDYTIMCEAYRVDYNSGAGTQSATLVARKSQTITVAPADAAYPGVQTICFDPDGNTAEAISGSVVYTDYADYQANWASDGGDNTLLNRLLFRRGKTHVLPSSQTTGRQNMTFGAYGTGAKPIVTLVTAATSFTARRGTSTDPLGFWRFGGLDFRGAWDDANESGTRDQLIRVDSPCNLVIHDCDFSGVDKCLYSNMPTTGTEAQCAVWLYDSQVTGFRDYGIQTSTNSNQWVIVRGSRVARNVNASGYAIGGKNDSDPKNWHGPIRIPTLKVSVIQASDFYSRSSWGAGAGAQPCLRIGTDNDTGAKGYWSLVCNNNVLEGGTVIISTKTENGGNLILPANCLIKHNILIGDFSTSTSISLARGATTFAENYIIFPAVEHVRFDTATNELSTNAGDRQRGGAINNASFQDTMDPDNRREPMRIIGNTIIDLKTPFDTDDELDGFSFHQFTGLNEYRGNVWHTPNHATPNTSFGPMEVAMSIASYNTYGARFYDYALGQFQDFTVTADGGSLVTLGGQIDVLRPQPGAGTASDGVMNRVDALGINRAGTINSGALAVQ
jgi:hypothetical protein